MSKETFWLKSAACVVLAVQCVVIGVSVWLIISGKATWVSYVNIAGNIAFGVLNIINVIIR